MININECGIFEFMKMASSKRVFLWGVSKALRMRGIIRTPEIDLLDVAYKIVDNNSKNLDETIANKNGQIPVISPEEFLREVRREDIILITSMNYYGEIVYQLDNYPELNDFNCYILALIDDYPDSVFDERLWGKLMKNPPTIPPIIHYCWFGEAPIPKEYERYIDTWKKYCPNFEIIEWNEKNYDIDKHPYMKKAKEAGMWAFVSDYARLDIVHEHGGFYLDTDVELINSLSDLRRLPGFIGFESTQMVNSGLGLGATKGNYMIKRFLSEYDQYIGQDSGDFDMTPCTVHQTRVLKKLGVQLNNSLQCIDDGSFITLPTEFLCGIRMNTRVKQISDRTVSLHHYSGKWGGAEKVEISNMCRERNMKDLAKRIMPLLRI